MGDVMKGYSEHRVNTKGRLPLERLDLSFFRGSLRIGARENQQKDRGVDIVIFLEEEDLLSAIDLMVGENRLLRLRIKAELARLDYEAALEEHKEAASQE
jgi:hypothetical protein